MQPADTSKHGFFIRLARGLLSRRAVWVYWIVNITLLVGLVIWICRDGLFPRTALVASQVASWKETFIGSDPVSHYLTTRVQILQGIIVTVFLSGAGILAALFAGTKSNRSVRAWLAVIVVLSAWLTIYASWSELAFHAQAWRISDDLTEFENLASTLLEDWPGEDGHLAGIGPFTAYPIGKPHTLRMLTKATVPGTDLQIAIINRSGDSELHFLLGGNEEDCNLVYSAVGSQPDITPSGRVKVGTLTVHQKALGNHWHLEQIRIVPILK